MPTLKDLLLGLVAARPAPEAQPAGPEFDPNQPWNAPALQGQPVAPQQMAPPAQAPAQWLDPYEEALRLAQRQEAIRQLTSPVTPVLDVTALAPKVKSKKGK